MKKIFKIALCTFLFFSFSSAFYANDIYIRPVKVRVVSEETGLPIKGLKVYNIASIEKDRLGYLFGIRIPALCIGSRNKGSRNVLLGEYETDENGIVFLEEKYISAKSDWLINSQKIIVNVIRNDNNLSDEEFANKLLNTSFDEQDNVQSFFSTDSRFKMGNIFFSIKSNCKDREIQESSNRYVNSKTIYYYLPDNSKLGYPKYRTFMCKEEEIEIKLQQSVPQPDANIKIKNKKYIIYNYETGDEIGFANFIKEDRDYYLDLKGNSFLASKWMESNKYEYKAIEKEKIHLKMQSIRRRAWDRNATIREQNFLSGKIDENVILIFKYLGVTSIPKKLREDKRDYYYFIILKEDEFTEDFKDAYNFMFCFDVSQTNIYKGLFYEDWEE